MSKYYESSEDSEEKKEEYEFPEYTNQELWELNDLLDKKYNGGKKVEDITQWLKDEGALSKYGGVVVSGFGYKKVKGEWMPVCDFPVKYEILQDKLGKASRLLGRKQWAQKKQLEDLDKIASDKKIKE